MFNVLSPTNTGNATSIGSGKQGFKDGIAEEAQFNNPSGITQSESDGSLLVCDFNNHKIRKITFEGIITSTYFKFVDYLLFKVPKLLFRPLLNNQIQTTTLH